MSQLRICAAAAALLVALAVTHAGAQAHAPRIPKRVPVTIVLVEELATGSTPFLIMRRVGPSAADLIVLPLAADARMLSNAVDALLAIRRRTGDHASSPATVRLVSRSQDRGMRWMFPWAPRVMQDLRRSSPTEIDGYGRVQAAVQIWLPRQPPAG